MKNKNLVIIAGEFHPKRTEYMLEIASKEAEACALNVVREVWVPGAFEMPLALQHELQKDDVAGGVLLGIIERGETKHGFVMAQAVFPAVIQLQLQFQKPVGIGVVGPEVSEEQIDPRTGPHAQAAVRAVWKMLGVLGEGESR